MISPPQIFSLFFLKKKGYKWGGWYCQSQQLPSPDGKPQGFVRLERDGWAEYYIGEFVDGKLHGHHVRYGPAGDVQEEADWLLGVKQ